MPDVKDKRDMKQKVNTLYRIILGALMTLLGFGSCSKSTSTPEMYGQPTAYYKFNGTIKDEAGNPIKGIRVVFNPNSKVDENSDNYPYYLQGNVDTLYTNDNGQFGKDKLKYSQTSITNDAVVIIDDVDGAANGGEFQKVTLSKSQIEIKKITDGDGVWYKGNYTITANATLKKN